MEDTVQEKVNGEDSDEISLVDLAAVLWKKKFLILGTTVLAAILAVVYAMMQPNMYTAQAVLLPIASDKTSALSQYAGLAAMAGVSLPSSGAVSPVAKIQAVLKSRTLAERLVDKLSLQDRLLEKPKKAPEVKEGETPPDPRFQAVQALTSGALSISVDDKTQVMKIVSKTKDPVLSRDIAQGASEVLETLLNEKSLTVSSKSVKILETQVAEQEKKVRDLQVRLSRFRKTSNVIQPEGQLTSSLALYQSLTAQKIGLEVEIERLQSALAPGNPKITNARAQLVAITSQIEGLEKNGLGLGPSLRDAPDVTVEYKNIQGELELAAKIYGSLLAGLESARLQQNDEKLYVEVIDPPIVPDKKSEPSRSMICVVGTMAGAFLGILLAFVLDAFKKLLLDPEVRGKFASPGRRSS